MQILKGIVILMTVVLVVGFTSLIYIWKQKQDAQSGAAQAMPEVAVEATAEVVSQATIPVPTPQSEALVALPAGARVLATSAAGHLLDVLVENRDGSRDLYQIARRDGSVQGILRFREEGP